MNKSRFVGNMLIEKHTYIYTYIYIVYVFLNQEDPGSNPTSRT